MDPRGLQCIPNEHQSIWTVAFPNGEVVHSMLDEKARLRWRVLRNPVLIGQWLLATKSWS
jgi:hypothetical protein